MSSSFDRQMTVTASTKRNPTVSSGKRGAPVAHLVSLRCTPLDPVNSELAQRVGTDAPYTLRQTFVDGDADVHAGDVLVVGESEFPIRSAAEWDWRGVVFKHLILETLRR